METPKVELDYEAHLADFTTIFRRLYDEMPTAEIRRCVNTHSSTLYRIRHPRKVDKFPDASTETLASLFVASIALGYPVLTPQRLMREWMFSNSQRVMHMGLMSGLKYDTIPKAIERYLGTGDLTDKEHARGNFLVIADPDNSWRHKYAERDKVLLQQRDLLPGEINKLYEQNAMEAMESSWGETYAQGRDSEKIVDAALGGKAGAGSFDGRSRRLLKLKMLGDPEEAQRRTLRRYDSKLKKLRDEKERIAMERFEMNKDKQAKPRKDKDEPSRDFEAMPIPIKLSHADAPRVPKAVRPKRKKGQEPSAEDAALLAMFGDSLAEEGEFESVLSKLANADKPQP